MKILAIETATAASSVALGDGDSLAAMAVNVDRRGHVGFLIPAVEFCFFQAGWKRDDVEVVAVDVGPGGFTGLRAGIATAQSFAAAIGAPLVCASSLTAIAVRAATGRRRIWAIVDMRRGQIAVAPYQPLPGGVAPDGGAELLSPEEFRATLDSDPADTLVVGDWGVLPDRLFSGLHRVKRGRPRYPSAEVLLEIAAQQAARGEWVRPEDVRPDYMRVPDVQINWQEFRSEGVWPEQ